MSAPRRRLDVLGFALAVGAALAALWWRWQGLPHSLSAEQAESLALARNIVAWLGPRYTEFSPTVAGGPSFAWLGVQSLVLLAGGAPEVWLPRVAFGFLGLALVLGAWRGAVARRRQVRVEDALPFVFMGLSTAFAEAGGRGSGASLWAACLALAAVAGSRALHVGRPVLMGALLGALSAVRLEALWLVVGTAPAWWLGARFEGRRPWREVALLLLGGAATSAIVLVARYIVFGAIPLEGLLPGDAGLAATAEFLSRQQRWSWAALCGLLIATVWRRFHLRGSSLTLSWVVVIIVLSTWSHSARPLFLGVLPLLGMLVAAGLAAARDGPEGPELPIMTRRLSWLAFGGLALAAALAGQASLSLGPIMLEARVPYVPPEFDGELQQRGLQQPFVVWSDGAEAAALFPRSRVAATHALTPELVDQLLSEGPPDVVDARLDVEGAPLLAAVMAKGPGGVWWLAEQSPDDDPRCPEGRLALLSATPEAVAAQLEADLESEQVARALLRWRCALAALEPSHLPGPEQRQALATAAAEVSARFEREGRLELAVRAAGLAASLSGEKVSLRSRAERLRARWLASAKP